MRSFTFELFPCLLILFTVDGVISSIGEQTIYSKDNSVRVVRSLQHVDSHSNSSSSNGSSSQIVGSTCDPNDFYSCGPQMECRSIHEKKQKKAYCICVNGYTSSKNGHCVKEEPDDAKGDDPEKDNHSYSAAFGAAISIILLVLLAGIIFFGVKYHCFLRTYRRIRGYGFWPLNRWRRGSTSVPMSNPGMTSLNGDQYL